MSKREQPSGQPNFRITINEDGTSNLDATMRQNIHDYISRLYPDTGVGTMTGTWRDIESERPTLQLAEPAPTKSEKRGSAKSQEASEFEMEISRNLAVEVYKKKLIKFEVDTLPEYRRDVIKLFSEYHAMLDTKSRSKLSELRPEAYRETLEQRNGEKLWSMVIETLIAGSTHDALEVNKRIAKNKYYSFKWQSGESLVNFRLRFEETHRRYLAAGNPKIDEEEIAKDYLWAADPSKFSSARNMLLNRKGPDGKKLDLPATVADMHGVLKDHIPEYTSKKSELSADPLAFVYQMSTSSNDSTSRHHDNKSAKTDNSKASADAKADDSKKKRGNRGKGGKKVNSRTTSDKKTDGSDKKTDGGDKKSDLRCNTCKETGHFAKDCPFKKAVEDAVAEAKLASAEKKKDKSTRTKSSAFAWADHVDGEDEDFCFMMRRANDDSDDDDIPSLARDIDSDDELDADDSGEAIKELSNDAKMLLCNKPLMKKYELGPNDMIMDTGSEISGCNNAGAAGVHSVRTSSKPLRINGIAGTARIDKVGIKKGFGKFYIHPAFPVTILSLGCIEDYGCKIKYATDETTVDGEQCIHVTTPEVETYLFKRSPGTTLYVWREPSNVSSFPVLTVADKKSQYTLREIKQADDANDFMAAMLWPHKELAKQMCRASVLTGNPISTKDIDVAYDIYGKPLEFEKGARTKQHSHKHVAVQELEPQPNRKTDLWLDIFYINKIVLLTAVSYLSGCDRPLLLVLHVASKKAEVLFAGCNALIGNLRKYSVSVDKISIDRESAMGPVEPLLSNAGYKVNMLPDHVVQAERNGRTIKEGVRKVQSSVKFPLFGALIVYTVYFVVSRLNMWPNPRRPDQPTPIENLTLTKRNFVQEAFGACLTYVRVDR
jgi:hypothetical protein